MHYSEVNLYSSFPFADSVQPDADSVTKMPGFSDMRPEERSMLLSDTTMNKNVLAVLEERLGKTDKDWMKVTDYAPDAEKLANRVAAAAKALHERLQQQTD